MNKNEIKLGKAGLIVITLLASVLITFIILNVICKIEFNWLIYGISVLLNTCIMLGVSSFNFNEITPNQTSIKYPQYFYFNYINGIARVAKTELNTDTNELATTFNFVNLDGNYISEKWWMAASDFDIKGCAAVMNEEGRYNLIGEDGVIKSIMWYPVMTAFSSDGLAKVVWTDGTVNFINTDGKVIWKNWKEEGNEVIDNS